GASRCRRPGRPARPAGGVRCGGAGRAVPADQRGGRVHLVGRGGRDPGTSEMDCGPGRTEPEVMMRKTAQLVAEPEAGPPAPATTAGEVVLLFPGQGAQRRGMAVDLYRRHEPFRVAMDVIFELWDREGEAIRADWLSRDPM